MVKCPHCGSTAQVKTAPTAEVSKDKKWLVLNCKCGCGCEFNASYSISRPLVQSIVINKDKRGNEK